MRPSHLKQLAAADFTFSTRKAEMPLGPGPPVRAMTRYTSEAPPPLMKALLPYTGGLLRFSLRLHPASSPLVFDIQCGCNSSDGAGK